MRFIKKLFPLFFSLATLFNFALVAHAEILPILTSPENDDVLKQPCQEITNWEEAKQKINNLKDTFLSLKNGAGLASTQVGYTDRFFVISQEAEGRLRYEDKKLKRKFDQPLVFVNPTITETSGRQIGWEGCFSLPGYIYKTERPLNVTIEAFDENGNKFTFKTTGFWAKCVCHENDHLDGKLCKDKALEEQEVPKDE